MTTTAVHPGLRAALTSPFVPIGHTPLGVPIYPAQGGRASGGGITFAVGDDDGSPDDALFGDDDEDDDEDEDEDDDRGDDEGDEDDPPARGQRRRADEDDDGETDWTPPDRDTWERVQSALKRANNEAGKRRRTGKVMERLGIDDIETWLTQRGIDPATGNPFGDDVVSPDDDGYDEQYDEEPPRGSERDRRTRDRDIARQVLAAEQRGRSAARDELVPILAEQTARTALRDAGFTGTPRQLERVMQSIDPGSLDLEFDPSGFELVGIDEEIDKIREDFPELFRSADEERPARRKPAARGGSRGTSRVRGAREVDGGDRGRQPAAPKTWQEKLAEQMMDRRR